MLKNSIRIAEQSPERVVISVVDRRNYAAPQREGALAFTKSLDTLLGNFHGTFGKNYSSMLRLAFAPVDTGTAGNLYQVILSAS